MLSLPEPAPAGTLPDACDVLIIGAGPSGSACATVLSPSLKVLMKPGTVCAVLVPRTMF